MEVAARGADGRMAQSLLHQMDRRAPIQAVALMSMSGPRFSREPSIN
jgi:hypothetical protein